VADHEIKALRSLLKDNGVIGIEQHRAKADAPYSYADGNMGYLRQADVVKFMEINGFEFVKSSEINANSKDTADHQAGVWTLPPALRLSKDDAASNAKYVAIGESDRMTLLFKKRP
jgi:predicted methyltransferase